MRLAYLAALSLILISSTVLVLTKKEQPEVLSISTTETKEVKKETYSHLPELKQISPNPSFTAESVIAVDVDSGVVLYEKNPDDLVLPASTTKIVTALTALDYYSPDDVLTVNSTGIEGRKMNLVKGEQMLFSDMLFGLLVFSANDAAEAIADNFPGGRDVFIAAMNLKASEIGLQNSSFVNPSGLEQNGHLTTARDLIRAAQVAMKNESFAEAVSTKTKQVKSIDGKHVHYLNTTNELLGALEGVIGVKTGWTQNANENLITFVRREDRNVITAILGSQDRFGETEELVDWLFSNYEWVNIDYSP